VAQYSFDFGDGATSNWVTTATIEHKYTTSGKYTVKLKVKDNAGAESAVATTIDVTIKEHVAPGAVTVSAPTAITKNTMTLTWSKNGNDDFSAYEIHMSKVKGFTPSASSLVGSITNQSITSYNATALSQGTKYYFKVRVTNTGGQFTDSSELETKTKSNPPAKSPGFEGVVVIAALACFAIVIGQRRRGGFDGY
jgi:PKD repeat protein